MSQFDLATKPDRQSAALVDGEGKVTFILDRDELNRKNTSRKVDREFIASALLALIERHGAEVTRRDTPACPGYGGQGIDLAFSLNGVGAMLSIDNLHGGEHALISWHNTKYPCRNFTARFCVAVGELGNYRPHHKATSCGADWYSLAMHLDGGLMLAARDEAFRPYDL